MDRKQSIPLEILDDLGSRFIINVPEEERKDIIRVFFQIELAHWFYLDFYCTQENKKLRPCGMKEFAAHIFQHIPFLKLHYPNFEAILGQWRDYKQSVPTYGAILLNEELTRVVLVQSFWAKSSWGFPKGKVNEDEDPSRCAVREVLEETGYDISHLLDTTQYIEATINFQVARLYIVCGVSEDAKFQPQTRGEIKSIEWFALADLPASRKDRKDLTPKLKPGIGANSFFMVFPFIRRLKTWILNRQQQVSGSRRTRHKSLGDPVAAASPLAPTSSGKRRESTQAALPTSSGKRQNGTHAVLLKHQDGTNALMQRQDSVQARRKLFPEAKGNARPVMLAQSWLNFKLDSAAILRSCFDYTR